MAVQLPEVQYNSVAKMLIHKSSTTKQAKLPGEGRGGEALVLEVLEVKEQHVVC